MIAVLIANVTVWPLIQLTVARVAFLRGSESFDPEGFLYRARGFEDGGRFYDRVFSIKRWKRRLPDGAALLGQTFSKARLKSRRRRYLQQFFTETCRGEWAHWIALLVTPVFFLWNPLWADAVMVAYALAANLPCILAQRYNRHALRKILNRRR